MAKGLKDELLGMIREGQRMTLGQQIQLAFMLSLPAILAQLSSRVEIPPALLPGDGFSPTGSP